MQLSTFLDNFPNVATVAGAQAAFITGLLNGQAYFNIHTTQFPSGEIRGQLQAVPEPAALLLMGTGLIEAVGVIRRRLRKQQR